MLVVEDEDFVRRLCVRILEEEGYRVLTARDGMEALALLEPANAEIRVVISDIRMPRLDGLGLSARLAVRNTAPPVILISGYNVDQPTGCPVILKPFHAADLIAAVGRALHTRPSPVPH